jgi:hypothetical protein
MHASNPWVFSRRDLALNTIQSTSCKCASYKRYFSLSVTKSSLCQILQRESVVCYLLQCHTPLFVIQVLVSVTFHFLCLIIERIFLINSF